MPVAGPAGPCGRWLLLDEQDRLLAVGQGVMADMARAVGDVLWAAMPEAERDLSGVFRQARSAGVANRLVYVADVVTDVHARLLPDGRLFVAVEHVTLAGLREVLDRVRAAGAILPPPPRHLHAVAGLQP